MRADTSPASIMRSTASSAAAGEASPACCAMSTMLQRTEQKGGVTGLQAWVRMQRDRQMEHAMEWQDVVLPSMALHGIMWQGRAFVVVHGLPWHRHCTSMAGNSLAWHGME